MAITIGSNIQALRGIRQLNAASNATALVAERLSSGQRINRASDDAAGLAISMNLRKDARVYTQAIRNGNDAISALSIADGAADQLSGVVGRLRELASQSANGTFSRIQRLSIEREGAALVEEFNRTLDVTKFNNLNLLTGELSEIAIQLGYGTDGLIGIRPGNGLTRKVGIGFSSSSDAGLSSPAQSRSAVGDFNGDGRDDFAFTDNAQGKVIIYSGNADGTISQSSEFSIPISSVGLVAGDFNGDGKLDLSTASALGVSVYLGDGRGSFANKGSYSATAMRDNLTTADFNGDGILDIVGNRGGQNFLEVLYGNGDGSFGNLVVLDYSTSGSGIDSFTAGDFDGDGIKDLAVAFTNGGSIGVSYGSSGRGFSSTYSFATLGSGGTYAAIAAGDVNFDGIDDLLFANYSNPELFLSTSNRAVKDRSVTSLDVTVQSVQLTDLNGDGLLDLGYIDDSARFGFQAGGGDGLFASLTTYEGTQANSSSYGELFSAADFNGDGVLDLLQHVANKFTMAIQDTTTTTRLERQNFTTQAAARDTLTNLESVFNRLIKERGNIGAAQSRILSALNTLNATVENSLAAAGRIMDADVANESALLVRQGLLQQAGAFVLAQANQSPALALSLLRGL
jgi:flagellin